AARQETAASLWHPHPLAKPFEHRQLDLVGRGRDGPDAGEEVEPRREPVAHYGGERGAARDIAEEAGMRFARMMGNDPITKVLENLVERCRMLRRSRIEQRARRCTVERAVCWLIAQRRQVLGDEIGDLATDALHR